MPKSSQFFIVPTPIGNLDDITIRANALLRDVDYILAEDTRHSKILLNHYQITTPMISLHDHNELDRVEKIIALLNEGKSLALISDAGTPLISDPGFKLVRALREKGFTISPLPGACAAITALSASGLPTDRFLFVGFLSAKSGQRQTQLDQLKRNPETMVLYESPRRILDLLGDIATVMGEQREVCLAKEITKQFETIISKPVCELIEAINQNSNLLKGEMVVLIAGNTKPPSDKVEVDVESLLVALLEECKLKQAVKLAASITGLHKNYLYELALKLKPQV